jgi:hypothetical protein
VNQTSLTTTTWKQKTTGMKKRMHNSNRSSVQSVTDDFVISRFCCLSFPSSPSPLSLFSISIIISIIISRIFRDPMDFFSETNQQRLASRKQDHLVSVYASANIRYELPCHQSTTLVVVASDPITCIARDKHVVQLTAHAFGMQCHATTHQ